MTFMSRARTGFMVAALAVTAGAAPRAERGEQREAHREGPHLGRARAAIEAAPARAVEVGGLRTVVVAGPRPTATITGAELVGEGRPRERRAVGGRIGTVDSVHQARDEQLVPAELGDFRRLAGV